MADKEIKLPVLFTEITWDESAAERYGKINTQNLLLKAKSVLTDIVTEQTGKIVQASDTQIFCTFPNTRKAMQAACTQQRAVDGDKVLANIRTGLKIGLHYGPVKLSKDDVTGDTVNIAAKIKQVAKPAQVLISRDMMQQIPAALGIQMQSTGKMKVKEQLQKIDIFAANWKENVEEHTVFIEEDLKAQSSNAVLILKFQGKKYKLSKSRTSFLFGRSNDNDIILDDASISRSHASVRYDNGRFKLIDQSTNGTYLQTEDKKDHFIHKTETLLTGKGVFCPGHKIEKNHPFLVYYSMVDK
ncbi:MAG: adenylate/guanylate cyclase domain-containing protein [Proteobacteria bacterium]|nr:adenylate/guanylate cyclase domain-containing protein [Pseudomonadota bacterium]